MREDDNAQPENRRRRTFLASATLGIGATAFGSKALSKTMTAPPNGLSPLTAQTTEGPYYLAVDLMRADITEGLAGVPLDIVFTVMDESGEPYLGSFVDIWHCDAQGVYSGFEQRGPGGSIVDTRTTRFLRGTLPVDAEGRAAFHSIYPGWYPGRTTHIHFKVKRGPLVNLTSQFFLPDTLSEYLYTQVPAYRRAGLRDTLNSTDGIAIDAGQTVTGSVREVQGRYVAALTVRVDRAANPPIDRPPAPGERNAERSWHARSLPLPGAAVPNILPPMAEPLRGAERVAALLPDAPRVGQRLGPPRTR